MKLIDLPGELAKEAHRILSEYTTGTAAYGIGLKLNEMVASVELSASAMPNRPTTNLNFWQAYQAMKRGEWVGCKEKYDGWVYDAVVNDDLGSLSLRVKDGGEPYVALYPDDLNSTAWYIVPKGPRYKVGDRFEDNHDVVREIVYVDSITGDYCVKIIVEGKTTGIQCCSCAYLDTLTKLPS